MEVEGQFICGSFVKSNCQDARGGESPHTDQDTPMRRANRGSIKNFAVLMWNSINFTVVDSLV